MPGVGPALWFQGARASGTNERAKTLLPNSTAQTSISLEKHPADQAEDLPTVIC